MTLQVHNNEIDIALSDLEKTRHLCSTLMKMPHYARMGEAGVCAVVQKAKSMGMNPLDALNGGMYFVQGKVELSGQAMLALIRQKGHSVKMDNKSTQTHVIMTGKRADNGDEWTVSFGIDDAKKAGIYKATWEKYPQTMCIWRCVSMLGRFLFSDVIRGCYVTGEISEIIDEPVDAIEVPVEVKEPAKPIYEKISKEQVDLLNDMIGEDDDYRTKMGEWLTNMGLTKLEELPSRLFDKLMDSAKKNFESKMIVKEEPIDE